jgi:pyridoxal phosphate enzyme (YggS family)
MRATLEVNPKLDSLTVDMLLSFEEFQTNVESVRARIRKSCSEAGRPYESVQLLAVTKTHPAEAVQYAERIGLRAVGENRVQEAEAKRAEAKAGVLWELIGHLQSNKAKLAAQTFDRIQSVDSEKLLTALDRASEGMGKTLGILLQINAGRDPAKSGCEPEGASLLLERALACTHLRVDGLMTIAPLSDDPDVARGTFRALREIRDSLAARFGVPLQELSMGMTQDLELAIAEGSTCVRVGTALFGKR